MISDPPFDFNDPTFQRARFDERLKKSCKKDCLFYKKRKFGLIAVETKNFASSLAVIVVEVYKGGVYEILNATWDVTTRLKARERGKNRKGLERVDVV